MPLANKKLNFKRYAPKRRNAKPAFRKRAVNRIQVANQKASTPTAVFHLTKYYHVQQPATVGAAPEPSAVLDINMSTPFQPLSVRSGTWVDNDSGGANEPMGLNATIYSQYKHCTVVSSHIKVNVMDDPDTDPAGNNTLVAGVATLSRMSAAGEVTSTTSNTNLKNRYGTKQASFTCGKAGVLAKSASLSNGYSAYKTWKSSAMSNQDLLIVNTSGGANKPADSTWMSLALRSANDNDISKNIKNVRVQLQITYKITFSEPGSVLNIPLPLPSYYPSYGARALASSIAVPTVLQLARNRYRRL